MTRLTPADFRFRVRNPVTLRAADVGNDLTELVQAEVRSTVRAIRAAARDAARITFHVDHGRLRLPYAWPSELASAARGWPALAVGHGNTEFQVALYDGASADELQAALDAATTRTAAQGRAAA